MARTPATAQTELEKAVDALRADFDTLIKQVAASAAAEAANAAVEKLTARISELPSAATVAPPAAQAEPAAAAQPPFRQFSKLRSSDRTGARKILRSRTLEQLHAAQVYEAAHQNRAVILRLIAEAIERKRPPAPARVQAPAQAETTPAADGMPFPEYAKVASSRESEARAILRPRTLEELRACQAYEAAHQNRAKITRILDALIDQKTGAAPVRRPGLQVEGLPFPEYARVASSRHTESRRILAKQPVDKLQETLTFERQTRNRAQVIRLIEQAIANKETKPAAEPAEPLPWRGYDKLASGRGAEARKDAAKRTVEQLEAALAYEAAHQNRTKITQILETALRRKQPAPAKPAAPKAAKAPTKDLPWRGYDKLASGRGAEARKDAAKRTVEQLEAALAYEAAHQNRTKITQILETALRRKQPAPAAAKPAAKAPARKPRARGRAREQAGSVLAPTEAPAPKAAEPVDPTKLPVRGYEIVASSRQTPSRRFLEKLDETTLERCAAWEQAQDKPRVQIIRMIEGLIEGKRREVRDAQMPFPEFARVASSRAKESRDILRAQPVDKLLAALEFEQSSEQPRVQIVRMIEQQLINKGHPVETGSGLTGQPIVRAEDLPFPEYKNVASSRETEARNILKVRTDDELLAAIAFERATQRRSKILRIIEAQLTKRDIAVPEDSSASAPAAAAGKPPFARYDELASSRETESREIVRGQSIAAIEAAIPYEQATQNRSKILRLFETQLRLKREEERAGDLPFPEYANVASKRETEARAILAPRTVEELEAAVAYEQRTQNRTKIIRIIEAQLAKKQAGGAAPAPKAGRAPKRAAKPATRAAAAPAPAQDGDLPFPGYDRVQSGKIVEARALLLPHDVPTLERALAYEAAHQNRTKITHLLERLIRQKQSGRAPRGAAGDTPPVEGWENVPVNTLIKMVGQGHQDARLTELIAWETAHQNRAELIAALQRQLSAAEDRPIVSPTGRAWQGKEPFRGYGSLDHTDPAALRNALEKRSAAELRRVQAAEQRQSFPSSDAVDIARELLASRKGRVAAAA